MPSYVAEIKIKCKRVNRVTLAKIKVTRSESFFWYWFFINRCLSFLSENRTKSEIS